MAVEVSQNLTQVTISSVGVSGANGTSGVNGTNGTSGVNGTSGTSGVSGTMGTSGTSGTSFSGSLDLESINSFTSSIAIRVEALEDFTSSFAITGVYVNVINPLDGSDTITITSTNTNVDTITANSLVVTGSVSGDGFDRFATTGSNSFIGDQRITGSVYIQEGDVLQIGQGSVFSTVEGLTYILDTSGYIQLDASNNDGSENYASLYFNANNDESLFNVYDNTPHRINASINLSTSGSFNISTRDNTATLLLNGVLYDAHLVSTSSFNTFTSSVPTLTGLNEFTDDQQILGALYMGSNGAVISPQSGYTQVRASDDSNLVLNTYNSGTDTVYDWTFNSSGSLSAPGDVNVSGSVYIDITDNDKRIYFSINGDTNTYMGTTMGSLKFTDGAGYIQLDAQNQDGSGNYAYLTLNANNDNTLFFVGDSTPGRVNASINLSTSGSFNISTDNNTATLLLDGVSYDAHLATTGSNTFNGNQTINGSLNVSGSDSMVVLPNHSTAPSTPASGALYFNTTDYHFYGWNGGQWKQLDN